jgi:hypothetical protein
MGTSVAAGTGVAVSLEIGVGVSTTGSGVSDAMGVAVPGSVSPGKVAVAVWDGVGAPVSASACAEGSVRN